MKWIKLQNCLTRVLVAFVVVTGTNSALSQKSDRYPGWKQNDFSFCSFLAPPQVDKWDRSQKDSEVWRYTGNEMRITIDRGTYSLPSPADKEELFYVRTRTYVAGRPATVVKFKYSQSSSSGLNYVVAFYFSPKKGSHEVPTMFVANVAGKKDQLVAEKMFKTIRFKA